MTSIRQSIMRAIRVAKFGGPENLKLEMKVPMPKPGPTEVLIRVSSTGVNPVDTYIRQGAFAVCPPLPYTPGQDASGTVEEVGNEVKNFKKGDRVLTVRTVSGAYAEYTTADELHVAHLDDRLTFAQGASIGIPYYTAYKALHIRAQAEPGQTVLVHGASGAVGIAAVQMGKAFGLRVVGTAGTSEGMELVKQNGADMVFNHRDEEYVEKMKDAVGGFDIILEMLSNVNLQNDLTMMNSRGKIMIIGCRGPIEINPRMMMGTESNIMGVAVLTNTQHDWEVTKAAIEAGQRTGWLSPHVGREYPLEEAAKAHDDVINNTGTTGKLVLDVTK